MKCSYFNCCIKNNCSLNKTDCLEYKVCHSKITCKENGRMYILTNDNSSTFSKYHVDGHVITGSEKKCDYMLINYYDNHHKVIFVELKGQHVVRAIEQILNTFDTLEQDLKNLSNVKYYSRIVLSKFPPYMRTNSEYIKMREKLFNFNNGDYDNIYVNIQNGKIEERLSTL